MLCGTLQRHMPFADNMRRALHFAKHGGGVGAATEDDYERMADAFMGGSPGAAVSECVRPSGRDRLRFRATDRRFGCAVAGGPPTIVRTFYAVAAHAVARRGGPAGFFRYECGRTNL